MWRIFKPLSDWINHFECYLSPSAVAHSALILLMPFTIIWNYFTAVKATVSVLMLLCCCIFTFGIVLVLLLTAMETFERDVLQILMDHCVSQTCVSVPAFYWCWYLMVSLTFLNSHPCIFFEGESPILKKNTVCNLCVAFCLPLLCVTVVFLTVSSINATASGIISANQCVFRWNVRLNGKKQSW